MTDWACEQTKSIIRMWTSTIQLEIRLNIERCILKIELKSVSEGFMVDLSLLRT